MVDWDVPKHCYFTLTLMYRECRLGPSNIWVSFINRPRRRVPFYVYTRCMSLFLLLYFDPELVMYIPAILNISTGLSLSFRYLQITSLTF